MLAGEELAWNALVLLDLETVCQRTKVFFDRALQTFNLQFFSHHVEISLNSKYISCQEKEGVLLLEKLSDYANLAILFYLIHFSHFPSSGQFVNPADLAGGQIYTGGTHQLPVQLIADKYRIDREGFINRGRMLGGRELGLADASLRLLPFPDIEIAILLWLQDDEFPARSVLLVDSSSGKQLPPDALWLTSMMCLMAMV